MTALNPDIFVSVILPCYNISSIIDSVINDLHSFLHKHYSYFEIIMIDDHSDDLSQDKINQHLSQQDNIRWIRFNRKYGQDIAISAGLESAIGDIVVVLDPIEDPLDGLIELIQRCHNENCILYGIQNMNKKDSLLQTLLAQCFEWYCLHYLKINIQSRSGIFRIFNRSAIHAFMQIKSRVRNLRIILTNIKFPVHFFHYQPLNRGGHVQKTNQSIFDDLNRSIEILVATSQNPLRWLSRLGIIVAFLNFLYCIYVLMITVIKQHVAEGWITLSLQSASMFFLLFLILSILSEYIGKILIESDQGPLYLVEDEKNSSVLVDTTKQLNICTESLMRK